MDESLWEVESMVTDVCGNEEVLVCVDGPVVTITLNRPEVFNALNFETSQQLTRALREVAADSDIHVVLLKGRGKAFSAGGDLVMMRDMIAGGRSALDVGELLTKQAMYHEAPALLHDLPKITIAVVDGYATGAGMSLALACDLRIASEKAAFATAFGGVGLDGDLGISWTLPRLVGESKAKELMLLGDNIDSQEAHRLGLVNRVIPSAQLEEETRLLAHRLASGPQLAYRYMKENIAASHTEGLRDTLSREALSHASLCASPDFFEGVTAFIEKRRPVFNRGFQE